MKDNFNDLTPAQTERLSILAEECGEVVQIVGKILRHGYDSFNPVSARRESNRSLLARELGDLRWIVSLILDSDDVSKDMVEHFRKSKGERAEQYLHHQRK